MRHLENVLCDSALLWHTAVAVQLLLRSEVLFFFIIRIEEELSNEGGTSRKVWDRERDSRKGFERKGERWRLARSSTLTDMEIAAQKPKK